MKKSPDKNRGIVINQSHSANARLLGTYQSDAIRNITGTITADTSHYTAELFNAINTTGAFDKTLGTATTVSSGSSFGNLVKSVLFDASRVVPTGAENRPINIALAPRIVAF